VNPDLLMVLDSASGPALSKAEWVRNDNPQSTLEKALAPAERSPITQIVMKNGLK